MAQFKGVFPAKELAPAPYGLLSVADVTTPATPGYEDHFLWNYYSVEFDTRPQAVRILPKDNSADHDVYVSGAEPDELYSDVQPFFIEVEDKGSAMSVKSEDRFARILRQIEGSTQKAVEFEFWTGAATQDVSGTAPYLTQPDGATVVTATGADPRKALYLLEQSIANSPTGGSGVIHCTRDVATFLFLNGGFVVATGAGGAPYLTTPLGTPVVVGSGYTGDGPSDADDDTATDTNKWMFVTGPVSVILGDAQVDNEDMARSINTSVNDVFITATRPAAVHFDPTLFYAAQVTLPDTP